MKMRISSTVTVTQVHEYEIGPYLLEMFDGATTPTEIANKEEEYISDNPAYFFEGIDGSEKLIINVTAEEVE